MREFYIVTAALFARNCLFLWSLCGSFLFPSSFEDSDTLHEFCEKEGKDSLAISVDYSAPPRDDDDGPAPKFSTFGVLKTLSWISDNSYVSFASIVCSRKAQRGSNNSYIRQRHNLACALIPGTRIHKCRKIYQCVDTLYSCICIVVWFAICCPCFQILTCTKRSSFNQIVNYIYIL